MSKIVPTYDEHKRLGFLAEKIFAIEHIANGDFRGALNDVYGKREAIFALAIGLVESLNVLISRNKAYERLFNESTITYLKGLRNTLGHRYNIVNLDCCEITLKSQLPKLKNILNENFPQSVNRGYAIYQSNLRFKESLKNQQEQQEEVVLTPTKQNIEVEQENSMRLG
ncbi:hypothetical protein OFO01_07630 [Campylobacter sp. JMF_01 NE2]|uniref:hypothetical protein n=1 Tax=unclassified Campylobacter TaxID=2593542 RepID=UPI0022E99AB9|nr:MULTISPECIES: hypothetical protein [unclassified Campylobacter]MDA3053327.1 hypothetical protein [Campylobacter sp. JMF_03 NE3]MDA3067653.1 hypothetical protein [Campylobacter sp. JMF_01 NE2]